MATLRIEDKQHLPIKALLMGEPGTGKTGAGCALANAGYKLRVINLDAENGENLYYFYTRPEALGNIDVVTLRDDERCGVERVQTAGPPQAFRLAMQMLDHWKYTDPRTGEQVDYGPAASWGADTVLIIDNLSRLGEAAFNRVLFTNNRMGSGKQKADWGHAMDEVAGALRIMTSKKLKCNVLVIAHTKWVGPPQPDDQKSQDKNPELAQWKEQVQEIIPWRLLPSALGQQLPKDVPGYFPLVFHFDKETINKKVRRFMSVAVQEEAPIKCYLPGLPEKMPIESGLLDVFKKVHGDSVPTCAPVSCPEPQPAPAVVATEQGKESK